MANLASNPWSFTSADPVTATPAASPTGLVLNADGTVSLTTTAAHGFAVNDGITIINATASAYNGYYKVLVVPTATTATLAPQFTIASGTAASGGGTAAKNAYNSWVRIEDISWQNASAAGQLLDMRDRNGNIIWQSTAVASGSQNRGKVFWVFGITLVTLQSGIVLATVN